MTIKDAVAEILKRTSVTQKQVADATEVAAGKKVNRGQLSAWLAAEGPLSEERQGRVARALLGLLADASREDGRDYKRDLAEYVGFLESSEAASSLEPLNTQIVDRPVSPREPTYIERAEDRRLVSMLDAEPLRMAIVGGPKLGKNSLLLKAEAELKRKVRHRPPMLVLRVDFARYLRDPAESREDLLPWLARCCEEQIGVTAGSRLREPEDFAEWLKRNVLAASRSGWAAVLLGQIDALLDDKTEHPHDERPLDSLLTTLSHFWDDTAGDREYERCKFILAFDRQHVGLKKLRPTESYALRALAQVVVTQRLPENLVDRLCERLGLRASQLQTISGTAWNRFAGHPLLTRALVRDEIDGTRGEALERAWASLWAALKSHWGPNLKSVCDEYRQKKRVESRVGISAILEESGLFKLTRQGQERFAEPITKWVSKKFLDSAKWETTR